MEVLLFLRIGSVIHHSREAFICSEHIHRRIIYHEVVIGTDFQEIIEVIKKPFNWLQYRFLLKCITDLWVEFSMVVFELESSRSNDVIKETFKSVLRDERFQSYLVLVYEPYFTIIGTIDICKDNKNKNQDYNIKNK